RKRLACVDSWTMKRYFNTKFTYELLFTSEGVPGMTRRRKAQDLIVSVDQGTTNTKAVVVCVRTGELIRQASVPVEVSYPFAGGVVQDSNQIWNATLSVLADCLIGIDGARVAGLTVANQRESVVAWDAKSGEVLGPMLGWQDARTASVCERLRPYEAQV